MNVDMWVRNHHHHHHASFSFFPSPFSLGNSPLRFSSVPKFLPRSPPRSQPLIPVYIRGTKERLCESIWPFTAPYPLAQRPGRKPPNDVRRPSLVGPGARDHHQHICTLYFYYLFLLNRVTHSVLPMYKGQPSRVIPLTPALFPSPMAHTHTHTPFSLITQLLLLPKFTAHHMRAICYFSRAYI